MHMHMHMHTHTHMHMHMCVCRPFLLLKSGNARWVLGDMSLPISLLLLATSSMIVG